MSQNPSLYNTPFHAHKTLRFEEEVVIDNSEVDQDNCVSMLCFFLHRDHFW